MTSLPSYSPRPPSHSVQRRLSPGSGPSPANRLATSLQPFFRGHVRLPPSDHGACALLIELHPRHRHTSAVLAALPEQVTSWFRCCGSGCVDSPRYWAKRAMASGLGSQCHQSPVDSGQLGNACETYFTDSFLISNSSSDKY